MSEWELDQAGAHFELMPHVYLTIYDLLPGEKWAWQIAAIKCGEGEFDVVVLAESQEDYDNWRAAQEAGLEASTLTLAKRIEVIATAELRRIKQAAQDADDAAIVAAHGEVVWAVGLAGAGDLHTATIAGHPCYLEDRGDQGVKWWLDPEYYGHPHTWYAPDLETAKSRAAAAALRRPCKRWAVEIPAQGDGWRQVKGGTVEVWAVTSEGALYRAAVALGARMMGGRKVEGKATEVAR